MKPIRLNKILYPIYSLLLAVLLSCGTKQPTNEASTTPYPIEAIDISEITLADKFWSPILDTVRNRTIPYALQKCIEEGRFDNFLIAGGKLEGTVKGAMPFDDSDVYKIIEGAAISLMSDPSPELENQLDSIIAIIAVGQEADGYLTTWRTINPAKPPVSWVSVKEGKRWESLSGSHELYNAGHMYEAAAVHYRATGKKNFLDIALKNADLIVKTFGDAEEQISAVPGHQIIETGLIQLYHITGEMKYLDQAKYFLDNRGNPDNHDLYDGYVSEDYTQDHIHPAKQEEAVGHAVRAVYMYAAMSDIATLLGDASYQNATEKIWQNMTFKKTYITGGIGAREEGEAFGDNYELPNKTGYQETCAAIGSVCWNHRLFLQGGDVKFYDVIERTLYNGLIAGLSLDGTKFFYPNTLESDGKYQFNRGTCTRQSWFDCSCCPTNLIRFLPSVPKYIYATQADTIYTNLYISNTATVKTNNNSVKIQMDSQYPWQGSINLKVKSESKGKVILKLRIPGWARNEPLPGDLYFYESLSESTTKVSINGKPIQVETTNGYLIISDDFTKETQIEIEFPMEVRQVRINEVVTENQGKVALEYGPLVYAIEEMDNPDFDQIKWDKNDPFKVEKQDNLLGGVNTLKSSAMTAIPYYTWSNRGVGKMKVWINQE